MTSRRGASRKHTSPPLAVDERLVMPETRWQVIEGKVTYVSPADQPHGSRHSKLSALLEAYAADGYDAAVDMLTRTSATGDMAPDGSVYPIAPDPDTGGRQIEELAFEVVSTEALSAAAKKASALSARGVRRVFALDVQRRRTLEWSRRTETWQLLRDDAHITDPVLVAPLPVHDLVSAAKADDAVARALLAKQNAVLVQALNESKAEGHALGKAEGHALGKAEAIAESVLTVLAARAIPVSASEKARIRAMRQTSVLERWLARAASCATTAGVFGRPRATKAGAGKAPARKRGK